MWEKNGVAISPNIRGGNLLIDSFSNLYIITATSDEEANYTCFVDDVKMQVVSVFVRQKLVITSDGKVFIIYQYSIIIIFLVF